MPHTVTITDGPHRPEVYADVEQDGEPVAEVYSSDGKIWVAVLDASGSPAWQTTVDELIDVIERARTALHETGQPGR